MNTIKEIISGIYKIENKINHKVYIGESIDIKRRWKQHVKDLKGNYHRNSHLQHSWNKHGEDSFQFEIIEKCDKDVLAEREMYWIEYFDSTNSDKGYNLTKGGDGTCGVLFTEERNRKISRTLSGRKRPEMSGSNAPTARSVYCLNDDKYFSTIKEASEYYNCSATSIVRSCRKGVTAKERNLVFMYSDDYNATEKSKREGRLHDAILAAKCILKNGRKVVCLNTREEFISGSIGAKKYNIPNSAIHKVCKGRLNYVFSSVIMEPTVWLYYEEYITKSESEIESLINHAYSVWNEHKDKSIIVIETGMEFKTKRDVSRHFGINYSALNSALSKNGKYQFTHDNKTFTLKLAS